MNKDLCRIGSHLSLNQWMKWPILGFLGLLILTLLTRCNPIENDIQERTQQRLSSEGMTWATTDLDGQGRDVLLTGEAPSEASRDNAIKLVKDTHGVRTVSHDISIKQYVSSTFSLTQADNKITLSGTLPDQASIDSTVSKAREIYGADQVVSELAVSDSARAPKWLAGALGVMAAMKGAEAFSLSATDDELNIGGIVESEETKALLLEQANKDFKRNITEAIQVVKKGPTPEELAAEAARLAEIERLAEEKRIAAELEAQRLAEQQRIAEEERIAAQAEARRLAEAERVAEEQRLAAEAEAEAEAAAEKERLAQLEAMRLEKEKQLAAAKAEKVRLAKLEALRLAEEQRLAKIEALRLAEEQKIAAAKYQRELLISCQVQMNHLVSDKKSLFYKDESAIRGDSYPVMAMLAMQINACSDALHNTEQFIDIQLTDANDALANERLASVISYLENINGAHRGLLRVSDSKSETSNETSELYFTISK